LKALAQDRAFDLLFTDVVLPHGMSGVELASQVRHVRPDMKVVLTSGYPADALTRYGYSDAGIPLLRKPFKRGELVETFRTVLTA
jgi:two-component SAPR family response regulator